MRKEQGFTLIELLIVLAILGILIGIVAMSVGDMLETAERRSLMSEIGTVQTAIDSWNTLDLVEDPTAIIAAQATAAKLAPGGDTFTQLPGGSDPAAAED